MSNQGGSLYTAALDRASTVRTGATERARAHQKIGRAPTRTGGRRWVRAIEGRVADSARGGRRAGAGACGRERWIAKRAGAGGEQRANAGAGAHGRRAAGECRRGRARAVGCGRDQTAGIDLTTSIL